MTMDHPTLTAVGIFLAYMLLVGVMWRITGIRYDALVDSRARHSRHHPARRPRSRLLAPPATWLGWSDAALFRLPIRSRWC